MLVSEPGQAAMEPPGYGRKHQPWRGLPPGTARCRNGAARLWAETLGPQFRELGPQFRAAMEPPGYGRKHPLQAVTWRRGARAAMEPPGYGRKHRPCAAPRAARYRAAMEPPGYGRKHDHATPQ